ncbi:hypothetical protein RHMOL_Rhmol08G0056800 [Rhododendron molle]|uniref:Uncharacterized protein n=1 Tax=Rhododendron molle TaxID=49168 RepID=A0ACC0MKJ1_RHOML|nr:hypothetical protein RHMOL_Rhmol08G0056800 [Rhododendron molle]
MGSGNSRGRSLPESSSVRSSSSSYRDQYKYPPQTAYPARNEQQRTLGGKYSCIADNYNSLEEVTEALVHAGLESSNLIVGIDFTKSNEWTGARSCDGRSLHHIGNGLNPYEQAISILGKTLAAFDEDDLIPCFGFGDGPTSFAPVIEMAMTIVEQSGGQYHVLLIIADGQVTRSGSSRHGHLSPQEHKTVEAIVKASEMPLSIIVDGVGDGPWDMMKEFDDNIPARAFDNFQFVNFTDIMSKNVAQSRKETEFALAALMEIPSQYKATIELNILGGRKGNVYERVPLPPPVNGAVSFTSAKSSSSTSFQKSSSQFYGHGSPVGKAPAASSSTFDN